MISGNAEGKGAMREKELRAACLYLGIPNDLVMIINDPYLARIKL